MKNEHRCPKCQSEAWHVKRGSSMDPSEKFQIGWMFANNTLTSFVCADCGYLERYLLDPGARGKIAARYPRAADLREGELTRLSKNNETERLLIIAAGIAVGVGVMFFTK